jgi:hypothetical protein
MPVCARARQSPSPSAFTSTQALSIKGCGLLPHYVYPTPCRPQCHPPGCLSRVQATPVFSFKHSTASAGSVDVCKQASQSEKLLSGSSDTCCQAGTATHLRRPRQGSHQTDARARGVMHAGRCRSCTTLPCLADRALRYLRHETAQDRAGDVPEADKIQCGSARPDAPLD